MNTEVIMKRELFGKEISQKSKSEFFSATDLIKAGNIMRVNKGLPPLILAEWLRKDSTIEFISTLEAKFGKVKISSKGRVANTWVHPFLFIDLALYISPDLKIEVYTWLTDYLLKYRNESGDSYKKMVGALWTAATNKSNYKDIITETARKIKNSLSVKEWNEASEDILKKRDKIHENIALLVDILPIDDAVRIGISKAL